MALSKLEQAGMNASALKDLISSSDLTSGLPCDEEIRGVEIVVGFDAEVESAEAAPSPVDGEATGADECDDEEIFEQLEQLEQDLTTGECNQPCDSSDSVDAGSLKGTEPDSPKARTWTMMLIPRSMPFKMQSTRDL